MCMLEYAQCVCVHTYKCPETHVNHCINKSSQDILINKITHRASIDVGSGSGGQTNRNSN